MLLFEGFYVDGVDEELEAARVLGDEGGEVLYELLLFDEVDPFWAVEESLAELLLDDRRGFANISDGKLDEELSDLDVYLFNVFAEIVPVSFIIVVFLHDINELF